RDRAAQDPQPGSQVAQRDQGSAGIARSGSGFAPGKLAPARPGQALICRPPHRLSGSVEGVRPRIFERAWPHRVTRCTRRYLEPAAGYIKKGLAPCVTDTDSANSTVLRLTVLRCFATWRTR